MIQTAHMGLNGLSEHQKRQGSLELTPERLVGGQQLGTEQAGRKPKGSRHTAVRKHRRQYEKGWQGKRAELK